MSSAFPLLRLPRLVLFDVFKSLSIGEKIKLSFCSKKVSTQINNCRLYSQKVHVHLDMYSHKIEVFENGENKFKIFNLSDRGTNTDPYKQQYQIGGNFGLVEYLTIFSIVNPAFTPVFTSWPQNISIMDSNWFTLKYLLACTSTTITLKESRLENKDMDEVLRKWKTGGFPNLQRLEIQSRNITSFGATIFGMNLRELNELVIHSDDGSKKATIKTYHGHIEISVTSF
ncbi:hypothetical protein CRE_22024 [Caenorhabditis remanei]|uniref:F-box domain-containing protein n=1 Tax=Caenorhabditis remanei TaxID=31234 RepID=E3N3F9_CAERE|nr:hypothetical protein CRE_22024 [Caenorhabditis remanei]